LWLTEKKKSVSTVAYAHGHNGGVGTTSALDGGVAGTAASADITPTTIGRGITAIGALKGSDMVASGSNDGYLRLWKVMMGETLKERGIESIGQIPVHGYINDVAIGPKARFCVVAVGQEPSLGRWDRVAKAKNRFGIIQLRTANDDNGGNDDDEALPEETIPEGDSQDEGSSNEE
jgi:ribosomal RNA-processing protein 9